MEEVLFEAADLNAAIENEQETAAAAEQEQFAADHEGEKIALEDFKKFFSGAFAAAGTVTHLKSLAVTEDEQAGADATAAKLYQIIDNTPVLSRLLYSQKAICDWFLIASFLAGKTVSVVAEVRGVENTDVVAAIAEKAGRSFVGGMLAKLKFWG